MSGQPRQKTKKRTTVPKTYQDGMLTDLDGRCVEVRALRHRFAELANDLGGVSALSYQKRSLLWRFCCLELWFSRQEMKMLVNSPVDETKWLSGLSAFISLLTRICLNRIAKAVPTLDAYLTNGVKPDAAHHR